MAELNTRLIDKKSKVARIVIAFFITIIVVLVIAAINIPNLDVHRNQIANEIVAMYTIKDIQLLLEQYKTHCGGYPESLQSLNGSLTLEKTNCIQSNLLEIMLPDNPQDEYDSNKHFREVYQTDLFDPKGTHYFCGYMFRYSAKSPLIKEAKLKRLYGQFEIIAVPSIPERTGFDSFYISEEGKIHHSRNTNVGQTDEVREWKSTHVKIPPK